MPTIASELDKLSIEVLEVLSQTRRGRDYSEASKALFARYALRVTPDNLRAWHIRRVAIELAESTQPDVRCEIDDYAEAIQVWRADRRTWATVSRLLDQAFGFKVQETTLRGWWHRRKERGDKANATDASVTAGVLAARAREPGAQGASKPEPTMHISPATAPASAAQLEALPPTLSGQRLPGESEVQWKIRIKRQSQAAQTGIQDQLLSRLEATGALARTEPSTGEVVL